MAKIHSLYARGENVSRSGRISEKFYTMAAGSGIRATLKYSSDKRNQEVSWLMSAEDAKAHADAIYAQLAETENARLQEEINSCHEKANIFHELMFGK